MTSLAVRLRKKHFWEITSVVLLILLIFSWYYNFDLNIKSKEEVGQDVVDFINTNIFRGQVEGKLEEVTEEYGLYSIKINIRGQELNPYATKDGKIFFPQGIELEERIPSASDTSSPISAAVSCEDFTKEDKPVVDLFVMSQCPYGTIAEKAISPVLDLLGDQIDFNLYFIANEVGEGSFRSLHGQPEVDEGIRQVCIMEEYPQDKLMDYLLCVAEDYRNVKSIWEQCANESGIDVDEIKKCADGERGKNLFSENIKVANERGVSGSPTLMINKQIYNGKRNPEGYKEGICCGFKDKPSECEETLNESVVSASGSC
jgi:hypothetical protein